MALLAGGQVIADIDLNSSVHEMHQVCSATERRAHSLPDAFVHFLSYGTTLGDIGNAILPGDDRNRTMTFCLACEYLSGII